MTSSRDPETAVAFVQRELKAAADPEKAPRMQAYMKTDMPFYGVQKPERVPILRRVVKDFPPESADAYTELVLALWDLPHREEKYLALGYAMRFKEHITPERLPLFRRLIVEGAWWDFVDEVATRMVRHLIVNFPTASWPQIDPWIDDDDMWIRRSVIICQVGAREHTDAGRLFAFCKRRMHEKEFFMRKAIGWALREYAKTEPEAVAGFINENLDTLSGLSYREGSKHIKHLVRPR